MKPASVIDAGFIFSSSLDRHLSLFQF